MAPNGVLSGIFLSSFSFLYWIINIIGCNTTFVAPTNLFYRSSFSLKKCKYFYEEKFSFIEQGFISVKLWPMIISM